MNYFLGSIVLLFVAFVHPLNAQIDVQKLISYPFDKDSLYGFNEEMAIQEGLSLNCTSTELKYFFI